MKEYVFLFDLDSTITKKEILPEIAKYIGKESEMRKLTEETMMGIIPFKQSFLKRIELLQQISVSDVNTIVSNISLNKKITNFIQSNYKRCYIVTGNLDVWISGLMERLNMKDHYFCSRAAVENNQIKKVVSVLDKELTVKQFVQPIISVGDGNNDAGMANLSDIAVGFGGVRNIAPALLRNIDYAFYEEATCVRFLESFL